MLRAVVIDDSAYNRVTISRMLASSGEIQVVAAAINGEDGIKQVLRHLPDLITLDLEMPVLDGFAFLRWLMANRPTPVIVVSSRASDRSVFKALDLGAVDFIVKPGGRVSPRLEEIGADLLYKARNVGQIQIQNIRTTVFDEPHPVRRGTVSQATKGAIDLVVIGSSTGGPPALQLLLESTALLPIPYVIAQHMPPIFTRLFAERVNKLSDYEVKEGEDRERLEPGHVYIAPGGKVSLVESDPDGLHLRVSDRASGQLYAPSVNQLFASASAACGDRLLAIVLTGMGDDGAEAVRDIRSRGGRTIAESADTAVIFGMPSEAIRTGAVDHVLPLQEIPSTIERIFLAGR